MPAIFQKDLIFVDEGNPGILEGGGINFYKWRKIADIISEVLQSQQSIVLSLCTHMLT
jgi:hypothetical protein